MRVGSLYVKGWAQVFDARPHGTHVGCVVSYYTPYFYIQFIFQFAQTEASLNQVTRLCDRR